MEEGSRCALRSGEGVVMVCGWERSAPGGWVGREVLLVGGREVVLVGGWVGGWVGEKWSWWVGG